jgi:hypothetical protein
METLRTVELLAENSTRELPNANHYTAILCVTDCEGNEPLIHVITYHNNAVGSSSEVCTASMLVFVMVANKRNTIGWPLVCHDLHTKFTGLKLAIRRGHAGPQSNNEQH